MGRSPCCEKSHTNKGAWTKEEDQRLINHIKTHGEGCWRSLPKAAGLLRCGKSCRLRWINYLRPDLKRGNFTLEEDQLIIKLHSLLGNKWSLIAGRLPGRTDNEIKNYWNTHIKRKLLSQGLDPKTHRPIQSTTTTNVSYLDVADMLSRATTKIEPSSTDNISAEETNSSYSTTTGDYRQFKHQQQQYPDLNLDLSMSLPFQSQITVSQVDWFNQQRFSSCKVFDEMPQQLVAQPICLCYQLGFKSSEVCNCRSITDGLDRYYNRPLNS
ncbi:hypothetical protein GIB67_026252 [Kingdonia uniflora]|uniref:Uncharacterized protein n=1 Tax=Kingdonia uniflora TaxID=39325 RepID=A0A7J7LA50_9MAGN|nr:hypothetical protein GIB67_026252 [Kingdonia uniflora]